MPERHVAANILSARGIVSCALWLCLLPALLVSGFLAGATASELDKAGIAKHFKDPYYIGEREEETADLAALSAQHPGGRRLHRLRFRVRSTLRRSQAIRARRRTCWWRSLRMAVSLPYRWFRTTSRFSNTVSAKTSWRNSSTSTPSANWRSSKASRWRRRTLPGRRLRPAAMSSGSTACRGPPCRCASSTKQFWSRP